MEKNQVDTNIVSFEDLDFLKNIGFNKEGESVSSDSSALEESPQQTETVDTFVDDVVEVKPSKENEIVKTSINLLLKSNDWEDVSLKYEDKEYESITDLLENVNADDALYESLAKLQKDLKEEKIKSNYIKVEDVDDSRVKLAKAIVDGVEYKDLIEYQDNVIDPVMNLDLSDERIAEEFVKHALVELENVPQKYVNAEISELKQNFKLTEKAVELQNVIKQNYEDEISKRTERLLKEREEAEQNRKESIKTFRKELKESDYSPTFIDKAVQLRYDTTESGEEHYLKLIKEKIKTDKDFEKNLMHMVLDYNDFVSKIKAPVKQESTTKILELVKAVPSKQGGSVKSSNSVSVNEADANFLEMIKSK